MASADAEVAELKARIDLATRKRFRAEADRDGATKARDTALKELSDRFGVSSVDEAKALMLKMQAELNDAIVKARQELDSLNL